MSFQIPRRSWLVLCILAIPVTSLADVEELGQLKAFKNTVQVNVEECAANIVYNPGQTTYSQFTCEVENRVADETDAVIRSDRFPPDVAARISCNIELPNGHDNTSISVYGTATGYIIRINFGFGQAYYDGQGAPARPTNNMARQCLLDRKADFDGRRITTVFSSTTE